MRPSWPQKSRGGCRCGFLLSSPLPERERASDDSNITQLGGKTFNLQKAQKGEPHAISVGCWPRPALVIGGAAPPCHRALVISTAASRDGGANTAAEVNLCAEPRCCLLLPCPGKPGFCKHNSARMPNRATEGMRDGILLGGLMPRCIRILYSVLHDCVCGLWSARLWSVACVCR